MNISTVFRWIMPGRGVRRTRHSSTKSSNGITTVQTFFTITLLLTAFQLGKFFKIWQTIYSVIYLRLLNSFLDKLHFSYVSGCVKASSAFECYTGDGSIMRRKNCPVADFSDLCFKKEGGK